MNNVTDIIAVTAKNQKAVNKAYALYRKYHDAVNAELSEAKQEKAYDKFIEVFEQLPKREQANFSKQHTNIHGYA